MNSTQILNRAADNIRILAASAVEKAKEIKKPSWAKYDAFPYLKPKFEIASLFLTDIAESDNYSQYRGYITMR